MVIAIYSIIMTLYVKCHIVRFWCVCVSVQGKGMELKQSSLIVQNVDDIVKDIHRELLIYTVNLKILESIGQGN